MIDLGIELDDFVRLERFPDLVFRVDSVQYRPPVTHRNPHPWKPRAYLHFVGGADQVDWCMLARWEPLEDLIKLVEMEVLARMSR